MRAWRAIGVAGQPGGCKGVCSGLPEERLEPTNGLLCADGRCFDEILTRRFAQVAGDGKGNVVVVLHLLGNHGPAYYKRYPDAFRRYTPSCDTGELLKCTRQAIVNTYDNALPYTDQVVAQATNVLKEQQKKHDVGLLHVSDHGESLARTGFTFMASLTRSGLPSRPGCRWCGGCRPVSPRASPWAATAWRAGRRTLCFTIICFKLCWGLLQVETSEYEARWDISATCRR